MVKQTLFLLFALVALSACNANYKITESGQNSLLATSSEIPYDGEVGIGSGDPNSENPPVLSGDEPSSEEPSAPEENSNVVECELNGPNLKIVLANSILVAQHSNAKAERVCMSENACLSLINEFASSHSGSLSTGAASSSSSGQCTHSFPGSNGTCKGVRVLSDAEVAAALTQMSN